MQLRMELYPKMTFITPTSHMGTNVGANNDRPIFGSRILYLTTHLRNLLRLAPINMSQRWRQDWAPCVDPQLRLLHMFKKIILSSFFKETCKTVKKEQCPINVRNVFSEQKK